MENQLMSWSRKVCLSSFQFQEAVFVYFFILGREKLASMPVGGGAAAPAAAAEAAPAAAEEKKGLYIALSFVFF